MTVDYKPHQTAELAVSTARGTLWNYWTFGASKLVVFVISTVLARLLAPDDFGLLTIGLVLITYLDTINDFGVSDAYIYYKQDAERAAGMALTINLVAGALATAIAVFAAPWVAAFFSEPRATPVIQVLAFTFIIESIGNIYEAQLKKEMSFKQRTRPELTKMLVRGVISIGMALGGFGVWSLVWGQLAGRLVGALIYGQMARWQIRPLFDKTIFRALISYGSHLVLLEILSTIDKDIDYVFVGQRLHSVQLGYYTMGFRVPDLVILGFCYMFSTALFPAFSKLQDDPAGLREGFLAMSRYIALVTVPIGIGLMLVAGDFVDVFYTSKWAEAIPIMQWLSLYSLIYSLEFNAGDIYKATGRPAILNRLTALKLILTIPGLWLAAAYGIVWVGIAQVIIISIITVVRLGVACRVLDTRPWALWQAMQPAFWSTLVMAVGAWWVQAQLTTLAPWARLIIVSGVGAILYMAALWFLSRQTVLEAAEVARGLLQRRAAA